MVKVKIQRERESGGGRELVSTVVCRVAVYGSGKGKEMVVNIW